MRIAIVDDIAAERQALRGRLEKILARRSLHASIFEFEGGEEFLSAAKKEAFTVSFLDIYMDGMTGIEAAEQLRTFDADCLLIFTTTSTDHALEGFRVRAMHYLVKPYSEEEVNALADEIIRRIPRPEKYIEVKVIGIDTRVRLRDIVYAEHFSHMIHIHTASKTELVTRQSFSDFTAPLKEDERFFLCGRGVIANLEHATDFDGSAFVMDDGSKVFVGKDLSKSARRTFMDFLFKRGSV